MEAQEIDWGKKVVWGNKRIEKWAEGGGIFPFDEKCINPASIDLKVGNYAIVTKDGKKSRVLLGEMILKYLEPALIISEEVISIPDDAVGELFLKTTAQREFIKMGAANWVDPGFYGNLHFFIVSFNPTPIKIKRKDRIAQLVISSCEDVSISYKTVGHYNGSWNFIEASKNIEVPTVGREV